MTTPISNNHPGGIANNQTGRSAEREGRGAGAAPLAETPAAPAARGDAVSVSRAAEILSRGAANNGQGPIQTPEQAAELVQLIKARVQADPAAALASQSPAMSGSGIIELLKAG